VQARAVKVVDCPGHFKACFPALSSMNQQLDLPHIRLTQGATALYASHGIEPLAESQ
jgi:hypothetical protein